MSFLDVIATPFFLLGIPFLLVAAIIGLLVISTIVLLFAATRRKKEEIETKQDQETPNT